MITFDDVKKVLDKNTFKELVIDYTLRQKRNKRKNNDVVRQAINELVFDPECIPLEDYSAKLQIIFSFLIASDKPKNLEIVKHIIDTYGYRSQAELVIASQYIDNICCKAIDSQLFSFITNGLVSINSIKELSSTQFQLDTIYGDIYITNAFDTLGTTPIPQEKRCGYCHYVTTSFLLENPDFYGAYYYIPLTFEGFLEHSVVIDPSKNIVFDLTNNATMDLGIWKKLYPRAFIISGHDLRQLYLQAQDKYNISLNMSTLEEVRRRTKK